MLKKPKGSIAGSIHKGLLSKSDSRSHGPWRWRSCHALHLPQTCDPAGWGVKNCLWNIHKNRQFMDYSCFTLRKNADFDIYVSSSEGA